MKTIDLLDQLFERRREILESITRIELSLRAWGKKRHSSLTNQLTCQRQRLAEIVADIHEAAEWLLSEQRAAEIKRAQQAERNLLIARRNSR